MTAFADFERRKVALADVLVTHFPGMEDDEAQDAASDLLRAFNSAKGIDRFIATDKRPTGDIERIRKAAKAVKSARSAIEQVGYHGSKTMGRALEDLFQDPTAELGTYLFASSSLRERDLLAQHLQRLQSALEDAAQKVDPYGMSLNSAFGEGPEFERFLGHQKQRMEAERHLSLELASLYFRQTAVMPKVSTDAYSPGYPAYGPFLDLTKAAFAAMDVSAGAEGFAREACKEFSPEKD